MVDPRGLRAAYRRALGEFLNHIKYGCRAQQADYVLVRTDQPLDLVLTTFLASRAKKLKKN
jgi:hypothetical protein